MGLSEKTGRERRRWPRTRHKAKAQVVLCPGSGRGGTEVEILDYSKEGIGLISHDGLLMGEKYVVREPHITAQGGSVIYTVVRAQRIDDDKWSIGLQVSNSVDPTEQLIEAHASRGEVGKLLLLLIGIIFVASIWWLSGHQLGPFAPRQAQAPAVPAR